MNTEVSLVIEQVFTGLHVYVPEITGACLLNLKELNRHRDFANPLIEQQAFYRVACQLDRVAKGAPTPLFMYI